MTYQPDDVEITLKMAKAHLNTESTKKLTSICKEGKWGYIDETGYVMIEPQFEIVTDISSEGTTVLITPVSEKKFFVKRKQTREIFEIKKNATRIGKDAVKNEICIQGNSAVSREHAVFYRDGENLFVEDLKSTNGTFVNGMRLYPGARSNSLNHGEIIRLGDEELEIIVQN